MGRIQMIIHGASYAEIMPGDCLQSLKTLPDALIQTCVTSPPYFGLRDYGHDGQIGLEATPDEFVSKLVTVFREVRRVLKDDGTLWLNLGDSYASTAPGTRNAPQTKGSKVSADQWANVRPDLRKSGIKPKDLIGIPWRVAFALQADGWYLRQDIIWNKSNPMPESVTDRCTKSHEYIFLLSKSQKYYFDHIAIKEPSAEPERAGKLEKSFSTSKAESTLRQDIGRAVMRTETRNKRSVWTVSTKPYKGAHFATFPPDLIEPCILAGSRPGDMILDPFGGSGTTAGVSLKHGRNALLCELNPDYQGLIEERIRSICK